MDQLCIKITKENDGKTIKEFLKSYHVGRGKIEAIRTQKSAYINQQLARLEDILHLDDLLSFSLNEKIDVAPNNNDDLDVVFEDDYILIVNKPAGYLIHDDNSSTLMTLSSLVAAYYYKNKIFRPVRYIHRLDLETTGLVLFAKDFLTEARLHYDMENHLIKRDYLGIIQGSMDQKKTTIRTYLGRNRHNAKKMRVSKNGLLAVTHLEVIQSLPDNLSLVQFSLETGRTHQIRVHMAYVNHPLIGDTLYGYPSEKIKRVALHSYQISLIHPIFKNKITIKCPIPSDMLALLK